MVKVLPNNFTLFESQRILSPVGEPLAITCSKDLLFIAVEECMIEAYDLGTLEQLAQLRTVSPVAHIAYNCVGDCIVTLERKQALSQGFVRVYFKWRGLSADKPMRILMASIQRSIPVHNRIMAEIVELPSHSGNSVSCLACCEYTGRIAVAMGSLLRVFYLDRNEQNHLSSADLSSSSSSPLHHLPSHSTSPTPSIEILLDIHTNTQPLEMISIMGDYIAFISTNEARVLKLSLFQTGGNSIPDYSPSSEKEDTNKLGGLASEKGKNSTPKFRGDKIVADSNFVLWSPSLVWEAEKKAHLIGQTSHMTSHHSINDPSHDITRDHMTSGDNHMTSNKNLIGTLNLKSIVEKTSKKLSDRETMEILGPVEYVWGHPLSVSVNHATPSDQRGCLATPECRVLTMLYRRFSAEIEGSSSFSNSVNTSSLFLSSLNKTRNSTMPVRVQRSRVGVGVKGGWEGLHTVQLIPTFTEIPGSAPQLVGISCFLANRFHSYLYDVHQRCRLLSSFSFMSKCHLASCDGTLLHALSTDSVETYTSRVFQAAIANLPRGSAVIRSTAEGEGGKLLGEGRDGQGLGEGVGGLGESGCGLGGLEGSEGQGERSVSNEGDKERDDNGDNDDLHNPSCSEREHEQPDIDTWLRQPIPPCDLNLTLMSTSKFIGCCYLATSEDYIIVVSKGEAEAQNPTGTSWLLQSLTLRKAKAEQMWNIYVLKLKSSTSLFQQFMEFADSMEETSPPMRQHLLSEGHVLLRRQVLHGACTKQHLKWLKENCFQLADSLCLYSKWNGIETHASHYFVMSGRPIVDVLQHILSTYTNAQETAYNILMEYLNLVLFEKRNFEKQAPLLQSEADKVLELYASHSMTGHVTDHVTSHVISVLLDSWLSGYSSEKALALLETHLERMSGEERCQGKVCHAMLCLKCDRMEEARQGVVQAPKECLIQWMTKNIQFILDSTTLTLTPLGKLVSAVQETCLLTLLIEMLKTDRMTFDDFCTLLKNGDRQNVVWNGDKQTSTQGSSLKHFLEMTILDRSKVITTATIAKAVLLLVEVLFARLMTSHNIINDTSFKLTRYAMHECRHRWLDNVVPFGVREEEEEEEREGGEREEGEKGGEGFNESVGLAVDDNSRRSKVKARQLQDLMQLQTLLCSCHMTEGVATRVEELLTEKTAEEREGEVNGRPLHKLSLQLIVWPQLGKKKEACQLCLDHCPVVTIDYCQTLFPNDLDLWVWLLERLLGYTECEGDRTPLQELYISLYKEALSHIITLTTPHEFLSLLPASGSVNFFLPFIERSCKLHFSQSTSEHLHRCILEQ